jgi:GAF domain-containing protein
MDAEETLQTLTSAYQQRLRWGAFVGLIAASIFASTFARLDLRALTVLAGAAAISNSLIALIAPRGTAHDASARRVAALFYSRTVLDLLILLVAIRITGNIESPVLLLLLAYLFVINLRAGTRVGSIASLGTLVAVGATALLEYNHLLPHLHIGLPVQTHLYDDALFNYAVIAFLAAGIYLGFDNSRRVTARLRSREARLAQSKAQLVQRVNELTAQREIGQQLAASLHLDAVLDTIGESALHLVQASNVHLFLYDESSGKFGMGVGVWADGSRKLAVTAPRENGLSRAIVRARHPIIIDNVESHPLYSTPEARGWNLKSIAGFPIRKGKRVLGVLNAAFIEPHRFTDDEQTLLLALADQAALAIDNASLYTQVEQRARELAALYRVNLSVSQSLEPAQLLDEALAAVQEVMQVPVGLVTLMDEEHNELVLAAQRGLTSPAYEEMRSHKLKLGEGFAGRVVASGEPLVVRDASSDPANVRMSVRTEGVHALATVPLKIKGRVLGTLQVARRDTLEFSAADMSLLSAIAQGIAIALENARLYSEAKRRADELDSLREIGLVTTSTLELREQLRLLYTQVQQLIHPDTFLVGLYDETRREINIQFVIEEGWELHGPIVPLDSAGLSPWVIRMRRPLRVADMEEEHARLPAPPRHETRPARSWLGVPLIAHDRVIGILSVQSFRPHAFSAADEHFLVAVAQHAALAIENARLYEMTKQRARELALLNEISRAISASLDLNDIYRRTVRGLADAFGYQLVSIYIIQGNELRLQAQVGYDQAIPMLTLEQGVVGRVARTAQVAFVRDVRADPDFIPGALGVSAEIAAPIRRDKRVLGVLDVEDRQVGTLTEEDVKILSTFAEQIGIAITNAELYQSVVERERLASSLRRVALALTSTLDSSKILDVLCQESLEFFGVHGAYVWLIDGDDLVGIAARCDQRPQFLNLRVSLNDPSLLAVRVIRERRALFLNDAQKATDHNPTLRQLFKPLSLIGVPLMIDNEPVGTLMLVDQRNPQRFGPADLERVTLLASQAAVALANARLYAQAEGRVQA